MHELFDDVIITIITVRPTRVEMIILKFDWKLIEKFISYAHIQFTSKLYQKIITLRGGGQREEADDQG